MTTKKTLVLIDSLYEQYGLDGTQQEGILFLPMLRGRLAGRAPRAVRKLHLSLPLPGQSLWMGGWTGMADRFDTVVLADAGNTPNVVRYLKRRHPGKRVIVWYRNPVAASLPPDALDRTACDCGPLIPTTAPPMGWDIIPSFISPEPRPLSSPSGRMCCLWGRTRAGASCWPGWNRPCKGRAAGPGFGLWGSTAPAVL